jgi:hypothetical protein
MPVPAGLYHAVWERLEHCWPSAGRSRPALRRLSLLITGLIAARSCVLAQIAAELWALDVTGASAVASIERRLRRTLSDERLTPPTCYQAELASMLDWPRLLQRSRRVVLALDESSCGEAYHLLRLSLQYWGGALPLAWALSKQNAPLPPGDYWAPMDRVLAEVAALLPPGVDVVVVADRAYDIAPLVERLQARGWHWDIRVKTNGPRRVRDRRGRERSLRHLVRRHLPRAGGRWKMRGYLFKDAGWIPTSVVGEWAPGMAEPLVVVTDLPPRWTVLAWYDRRFWIEAGFRTDKSHGWEWEQSQVQGLAHHTRLVLAMAWASLLMLVLGVAEAQRRLATVAHRPRRGPRRPGRPRHARASLFTLGLQQARRWLYGSAGGPLRWWLPILDAPSWRDQWQLAQASYRRGFQTVRP